MSFQDKYEEYKQRKEAKQFFNQNNDAILKSNDYLKVILGGILVTIILSFVAILFQNGLGFRLSILDLVVGYLLAIAMKRMTNNNGSNRLGIIAVIVYFVGIVLANTLFVMYSWSSNVPMATILSGPFIIDAIRMSIFVIFQSGLVTLLFYVLGAVVAYSVAKE